MIYGIYIVYYMYIHMSYELQSRTTIWKLVRQSGVSAMDVISIDRCRRAEVKEWLPATSELQDVAHAARMTQVGLPFKSIRCAGRETILSSQFCILSYCSC